MDIIDELKQAKEVFWRNEEVLSSEEFFKQAPIKVDEIDDARARLNRFKPLFMKLFKETSTQEGIIESPIRAMPHFKDRLLEYCKAQDIQGSLWFKLDSHLPISGSIKARGGIYEVLAHTERLLLSSGKITLNDDYSKIATDEIRNFLSQYKIAVGSTGNLGLSIGIMGAKLGFKVFVHMSADARQWKKDMLRSYGVCVVEYEQDYGVAVAKGREESKNDPSCYFVDDENSKDLFLGYSVAAKRLQGQLQALDIRVDAKHPLFVYLPCGVGGGPGGVAFGLKAVFGDHVKCFFVEPTHSPCMLLGLASKKYHEISVNDIGLDNKTAADGLAVGRASVLVSGMMKHVLEACLSVSDENMYRYLTLCHQAENIQLEPSALAGVQGFLKVNTYLKSIKESYENITHLVWATGGSMVPDEVMKQYIKTGEDLL